jgi:hypothetical protein
MAASGGGVAEMTPRQYIYAALTGYEWGRALLYWMRDMRNRRDAERVVRAVRAGGLDIEDDNERGL